MRYLIRYAFLVIILITIAIMLSVFFEVKGKTILDGSYYIPSIAYCFHDHRI